ncbi:MAG: DegT/DnrJ/EryC1/StrS family aminotransferase, partial [Planctomycetota bacterium]
GRPAGSWGDAGVLSFGGSKLLTAGRGGALLTNGAGVAQRAKVYTNRGNDAFAMSNLQAAALLPQLDSLAQHTATRAEAAAAVFEATAGEPSLGRPTPAESPGLPAYYKLAWRLRPERLRSTREEVVGALQAERAPIDTGFRGFTKRSARRCRVVGDLVNSAAAGEETLLLHHPALLGPPRAATQLAAALAKVLRHFGAGARGKT